RIVGDDDAFDDSGLGFGWSWDDLPDDYAASVSALQFNENAVSATISPAPAEGDFAALSVAPSGSGLDVVSGVTTGAPGAALSLRTSRLPGSTRLRIEGVIPVGHEPAVLTVSVD